MVVINDFTARFGSRPSMARSSFLLPLLGGPHPSARGVADCGCGIGCNVNQIAVVASFICVVLLSFHALGWAGSSRTIMDVGNRSVQVPDIVRAVICLGPGTLRAIVYLGGANRVVGVEHMEKRSLSTRPYWLAHPEFASVPLVGAGGAGSINKEPDLEAVMRLRPDVIFVSYMAVENADKMQKKLGIPVVLLSHGTAQDEFTPTLVHGLKVAGEVLGRQERARDIVGSIERCQSDVARRISDIPKAKTPMAYIGCVAYKGIHGIESSEGRYPPFDWIRTRTVSEHVGATTHFIVDKERLLKINPDVIFLDAMGVPVLLRDAAVHREYYKALKAFQTSKVFTLFPFNAFAVNAGNAIANAYAVGKVLYPDRFQDVDLQTKSDEIYSFLVGKPVYRNMVRAWGPLGRVVDLHE